jgi:hypothetical protein
MVGEEAGNGREERGERREEEEAGGSESGMGDVRRRSRVS